jgi:hypothetical protein
MIAPVNEALDMQWSEVVSVASLGQMQKHVMRELFSKKKLPPNWDGYGSPPPSEQLIDRAAHLMRSIDLEGFSDVCVIALPGGGVQVECEKGSRQVQISFFPDETIEFLKLEDGTAVEEGVVMSYSQLSGLKNWLE